MYACALFVEKRKKSTALESNNTESSRWVKDACGILHSINSIDELIYAYGIYGLTYYLSSNELI